MLTVIHMDVKNSINVRIGEIIGSSDWNIALSFSFILGEIKIDIHVRVTHHLIGASEIKGMIIENSFIPEVKFQYLFWLI